MKLNFLLDTFEEKTKKEDVTEDDYEVVVRVYLFFLLGCTLFCDKSVTEVPVNYLKCLENANQLNEQASGMGALAFLYRQSSLASRQDVRQMDGYMTPLTVSISIIV